MELKFQDNHIISENHDPYSYQNTVNPRNVESRNPDF